MATVNSQGVFVSRVVIQEQIIPAVKLVSDDGDEMVFGWVAPGRVIRERLNTLKDRRVGVNIRQPADVEAFCRSWTTKKFAPGTCDSGTFVAEMVKTLTNIPLPANPETLLSYVDVKLSGKFAGASVPSNEQAFTNHLYLNPEDGHLFILQDQKPSYVKLGDFTYCVESHPQVKKGEIGMNGVQRAAGRIALGQQVAITSHLPNRDAPYIMSSVTVEVDFAVKGHKAAEEVFDADAFGRHLCQAYMKQFFTLEQKFITNFAGVPFSATIKAMEMFTDGFDGSIGPVSEGMIHSSTNVQVAKPNTSTMKLKSAKGDGNTRANELFRGEVNFEKMGIGGLDSEFLTLFRRAFVSRVYPPAVIAKMGIKHVKGIMLYGPPGCGKTLIARQIGELLKAKVQDPVNGPEILNRYVGAAEEAIRKLFEPAEKDYAARGEDADLHLVIFDEIDAICKQRGSKSDSTGVMDQIVNQLLTKMDGVKSVNNVLVIAMTNRLDLIDDALLRPGRFELHIEIGLPDEKGRNQIFRIHTHKMAENKILGEDVNVEELAAHSKNYSGAEIEGVVRSATSFALSRRLDIGNLGKKVDLDDLKVTQEDFVHAMTEVVPAFGIAKDEFENCTIGGMIPYGDTFHDLFETGKSYIEQLKQSERMPLLTVLLEGKAGCGKTALAATLAMESGAPFVKLISPESLVGYGELAKAARIQKIFADAYKSPFSIIVLDNIERLIEYVNVQGAIRFSGRVLQDLIVLCSQNPPRGRKLLVIGTTSQEKALSDLGISDVFNVIRPVPWLPTASDDLSAVKQVLASTNVFHESEIDQATAYAHLVCGDDGIGIKRLLHAVDLARKSGSVALDDFRESLTYTHN